MGFFVRFQGVGEGFVLGHEHQDGEQMNTHYKYKMGTLGVAFAVAAMSLGAGVQTAAAADLGKADADPVEYKSAPSGTEISFTPRAWYAYINQSYPRQGISGSIPYQGPNDTTGNIVYGLEQQQSGESAEVPLIGGTFTIRNPQYFGGATLAITALSGSSSPYNITQSTSYYIMDTNDPSNSISGGWVDKYKQKVDRLDLESLVIYPVAPRANLLVGGRYIGTKYSDTLVFENGYAYNLPIDEYSQDRYYFELGGSMSTPISTNGKHAFFANVTGLIGMSYDKTKYFLSHVDVKTNQQFAGVDANVGYAYDISDNMKFSARYRLYAEAPIEDWSSKGNWLSHGPEVGLTYTFKDARESFK